MNTRSLLLSTCALVAVAAPALAAEKPAEAVSEVVVTATRTPLRLDQVGQSITVLNEAAIKQTQSFAVVDLLAQTPGVTFSRNGGQGKTTSVYIRGAETGQTVILIDGVRLNDPSSTDTGASLSDVVTGDIARIEVLRGAQSTLWGSQAIGGVINMITHTPTEALEVNAAAEGGGLKTFNSRLAVGGHVDKLTWRLSGSYFTTDGVSAYALGTENDGYSNGTGSARVSYQFTDNLSVDARAILFHGHNEFDNTSSDARMYGENRTFLTYVGVNYAMFDQRLQNRVSFQDSDLKRINIDQSPARVNLPLTFDALGITRRYEYQGTFKFNDAWLATFGAEREDAFFRTASPTIANPRGGPARARDDTTGVYAQLQAELVDGLTLVGGVRHEDQSFYGGHTVVSGSAAWSLNEGQTVFRASYGEGFKAPSLFQLFSDFGNLGLNPESAKSWDIGVEHRLFGFLSLSAVYFDRDSTNLIVFTSCTAATRTNPLCAAPRTAFYDNVGKVHARGEELGASATWGGLSASANYTHLKATNTTPGDVNRGKKLARRPDDSFNATVNYTWPIGLQTGVGVRYVGDSFNNAPNTQFLKTYTLWDFRASYPINDNVEVFGRVENAFDKSYQTTLNFGSYGRVAYGGVRLKF